MQYRITVQIDGQDVSCGTLYQNVRHGEEMATFAYDTGYLSDLLAGVSDEARESARALAEVLSEWQSVARPQGISEVSIKAMEPNFGQGIAGLQTALK